MSAFGPKLTFASALHMSAFGGKADMTFCGCLLSRSLSGVKRTCDVSLTGPCSNRYDVLVGSEAAMRRRAFIAFVCSMAAWPFTAGAQQAAMPVIGFLNSASPGSFADFVRAFTQGLAETGFVEGRNVVVDYRWAENQNDRLPTLAADLVRRQVAVIVAI